MTAYMEPLKVRTAYTALAVFIGILWVASCQPEQTHAFAAEAVAPSGCKFPDGDPSQSIDEAKADFSKPEDTYVLVPATPAAMAYAKQMGAPDYVMDATAIMVAHDPAWGPNGVSIGFFGPDGCLHGSTPATPQDAAALLGDKSVDNPDHGT